MQYVCDAPKGRTWFRIETEGEAAHESRLMRHTVEKYFCREREKAVRSWRPERPKRRSSATSASRPMYSERCRFSSRCATGRVMHWLTAMLPPGGKDRGGFRIIIVAASNADPYPEQDAAIAALGAHFGLTLDRHRCFPYGR